MKEEIIMFRSKSNSTVRRILDAAMTDFENGDIDDEVLKYKAGW